MPTPDIFDFDAEHLTAYDPKAIDKILVEQPALYINHLRIARSIRGWASRARHTSGLGEDYRRGYVQALREVAAHLREGDYVEGGALIINQEAEEPGLDDER
ncbi:hypothetical protein [Mycobacteroides abscessus]|uniref:hypothetical protein n=1 Tax=Mycobacteroides abscessus TaxID=36809 RepID=UPI0009276523|nr:hypothetical protein [Mycobacteroides abscessus]SIE91779.1 Uncharacterised protein [Mycobacteroides abscessus subsp. abscessus]